MEHENSVIGEDNDDPLTTDQIKLKAQVSFHLKIFLVMFFKLDLLTKITILSQIKKKLIV